MINSDEKILFFTFLNPTIIEKFLIKSHLKKPFHLPWRICVKNEIVENIKSYDLPDNYIGIHYRNTDIKLILIRLQKKYNSKNLFIATDDSEALSKFKDHFGNDYKIYQLTDPMKLNPGQKNIHYSNPDKDKLTINTLIDTYYHI